MLGDCVRCAVVPGYGGSTTPANPGADSGNNGGGTQDEGGTFGDGGTSDGGRSTDGALFDTGPGDFDGTF
jgi:hypothetical protein